jgi:acid phosphatase
MVILTALGYDEVFARGSYYNGRYIDSNSSSQIHGTSTSLGRLSQLNVSAPTDNVIQNSAVGWLQGFIHQLDRLQTRH